MQNLGYRQQQLQEKKTKINTKMRKDKPIKWIIRAIKIISGCYYFYSSSMITTIYIKTLYRVKFSLKYLQNLDGRKFCNFLFYIWLFIFYY